MEKELVIPLKEKCVELIVDGINHMATGGVIYSPVRKENNMLDRIKKYIINNKAVIIFWKDGNKTIAKVDENDKFDKETGFMIAFHKYLYQCINKRPYSNTEYKKIINCIENEKMKEYLFIFFNKYTFQDTLKSKKYLKNLKEGTSYVK